MTDPRDAYDCPFKAEAAGPYVVVFGVDAVAISMTPEAVLASLRPLYEAAADAMRNRNGAKFTDIRRRPLEQPEDPAANSVI